MVAVNSQIKCGEFTRTVYWFLRYKISLYKFIKEIRTWFNHPTLLIIQEKLDQPKILKKKPVFYAQFISLMEEEDLSMLSIKNHLLCLTDKGKVPLRIL